MLRTEAIQLGEAYRNATLVARLVTFDGNQVGEDITAGFRELGGGHYTFQYEQPDGFTGLVKISEIDDRRDRLAGRLPLLVEWVVLPADADTKKKKTWQVAKKLAEAHCARNPFPGVNALAGLVECSPSTILKAIDRSDTLRAKHVEHMKKCGSVTARGIDGKTSDSLMQVNERDPHEAASTDELFARLVQEATPAERARLHALSREQQRELVAIYKDDPDMKQQEKRNKQRKKPVAE